MAKSNRQKQKILLVARYLLRESDQEHPVSMGDILAHLKANGVEAERKSVYDDLEALRNFGMDIIVLKGKKAGYFVGEREFELTELKLLVDAVQSSRFLTHKKSEKLIGKLQGLTDRHSAKSLAHTVFVTGRVKSGNETVYLTVNEISRAMEEDRKIRFYYFEWKSNGEKNLRRGGEAYVVSPYHLVWDDENYYLVAFDSSVGEKRHFRVDKMLSVEAMEEKREGEEIFRDLDPAQYENRLFGMFQGKEETVTLWCAEELAGVFFDRFGSDLVTRRAPFGFETTLHVSVSPLFFSWISGFGDRVEILSPETVRQEYCSHLKRGLLRYESKVK